MNWFQKRQPQTEDDAPRVPKNPDNIFIFRVVAVAYILYMVWKCIQAYLEGGEGTPSLPVVVLTCLILGGGSIALGIISYRKWKADKAAYKEYLEEEAAAEARQNEGSEDGWSDEDWDIDPDAIEQEDLPEENDQ